MAKALTDVDMTYGYFSQLWLNRYDCTGSEYFLQCCSNRYYYGCHSLTMDLAGVYCTNVKGSLKYLPMASKLYHTCIHLKGVFVLMDNYNWLEGKHTMKEDLSIAIKASGHQFVVWMIK